MEDLKCKSCGAALTPDGGELFKCEYCGSRYRIQRHADLPPFLIQTYQAPVHKLVVANAISHDLRERVPPEVLAEHAKDGLARKLAEGLTDYLKVSVYEDPIRAATIIRGEIRVVQPDFKF